MIDVRRHHIIAERDGKIITKDAEKWKNFKSRTKSCYSSEFISGEREEDDVYVTGGDSDAALYQ